MLAVNGGSSRSTVANTATFLGVCGAPRPGGFSLRRTIRVVINIKVDAAAIILAMSVLLKTLS